MFKVVLDTNNFVSSQISKKGASTKTYHLWREKKVEILTSPFQLKELEKVLEYPRIKKKYRLSSAKVKKMVKIIRRQTTVVYPLVKIGIIEDDPADNQILEIALEGKADYIISGDQHLLKLKKFKNIPIITAKKFLEK